MTNNEFDIYKTKHDAIVSQYEQKTPFLFRGKTKAALRLMGFILWCSVLIESGLRYFALSYVDFDATKQSFYFMCAAILAVSIILFKPYRLFTDASYYGKITSIAKLSDTKATAKDMGNTVGMTPRARTMALLSGKRAWVFRLTIQTPSGRIKKRNVTQSDYALRVYRQGSYVSVLCGVRYPVPIDKSLIPEGNCICPSCASLEASYSTRCSMCRNTLWYK